MKLEPDVAGLPPRQIAVSQSAAKELKERTFTKLYNARPTWLLDAHRELDVAVAAAYGLSPTSPEDELLSDLLQLNLSRAVDFGLQTTDEDVAEAEE